MVVGLLWSACAAALNIALTGSNSGIGRSAAAMLVSQGHTIYHACRTEEGAQEAVKAAGGGVPMVCDLSDLSSVRAFAEALSEAAPDLDVLCLNSGVSPSRKAASAQRTRDGFEATIGINHIGHFCLANLLQPLLAKRSGRLVVTASGVHDPESPGGLVQGDPATGATLGDLSGLGAQPGAGGASMVDGATVFNGAKAYHDSKLCNVLFSREAHRRWGDSISVRSFNPGLITDTGSSAPRARTIFLPPGLLIRRDQRRRLFAAGRGRRRAPVVHGDGGRDRGPLGQLLLGAVCDEQGGDGRGRLRGRPRVKGGPRRRARCTALGPLDGGRRAVVDGTSTVISVREALLLGRPHICGPRAHSAT